MSDISRDYSFGGWLREIRIKRQISLREAARVAEIDPAYLSKLERSEMAPPQKAKAINKILKAWGCEDSCALLNSLAFQHHLSALQKEFFQ